MKIERRHEGTVEVLEPLGPLVDDDGREFADILEAQTHALSPRFIISMKEVPYIDSQAIEAFLEAAETLQEQNARLKFTSLTPTCREIFDLTGVAEEFQVFENIQDAVRSYM